MANSEKAPPNVVKLVKRFCEQVEDYRAGRYNETQVRREFIDPLFKALGWDVDNAQGYAEAYKDVIHEDAIKIGGATKAPDYGFRIGGVRKFFVEAKKPSVDIQGDASPAYQLRRYAWSAKLPLSILTDFEELAVYDCRVKPNKSDKSSKARTLFLRYDELPDRWDELASIFSREAILKGSFDKYAESSRKKRGTAEVDDAFLAEIEDWRDLLSRNIALRNEEITQRDLNFAVQRTIDRIVFLRICEDRRIEPYGQLQALTNGEKVYDRLFERFRRADERYNSGLFHFSRERGRPEHPDDLTPGLVIDDKPLKDILRRLYYPESPYEFSVLPADILGHVYEQFLGKVIRLTAGHQAKVEEKPEVRKAGGVYYTPTYIVEYIVQHTIGKLVEGKTPQQVGALTAHYQPSKAKDARPLAVLDPACGSGSFLLGAYQFLLDWYRDGYVNDGPKNHTAGKNPRLYQHPSGEWRLTTAERKRILLSHIHGVDIDSQAVEVTKLSLLLKVLEGESAENLDAGLRLFHERVLPDLSSNIKCGNSLIGPDFYETPGGQMGLFDEEQRLKINVFDWQTEFKDIMNAGGFDAVIGNPPYLFITEVKDEFRHYYQNRYRTVKYRFDLYGAFIEKGLRELLADGAAFGFIIPHTLLSNTSFEALRACLANETRLTQIVDIGHGVFTTARNETMLLFFQKQPARPGDTVEVKATTPAIWPEFSTEFEALQQDWARTNGDVWLVHVNGPQTRFLARMKGMEFRLEDYCIANQGLRTGNNEKYLADHVAGPKWRRAAGGKNIARYGPIREEIYVFYEPSVLDAPRRPEIFFSERKIIVQEIRNISLPRRIVATLDEAKVIGLQSTNVINSRDDSPYDLRYILGLLNSEATNVYFRLTYPGNNHIPSNQLLQIPVPPPDNEARHDEVVTLVQQILDLHKQLPEAKTAHAKTAIQRQIDATDRRIDQLVYELYGLTDEEIAIVEEATA
jgi:predicted type IV restriction endonuclease